MCPLECILCINKRWGGKGRRIGFQDMLLRKYTSTAIIHVYYTDIALPKIRRRAEENKNGN